MSPKLRALVLKLREPSTWAGLGLMWAVFGPSFIDWQLIVNAGTAVAALLAVLLGEHNGTS